MLEVHTTTKVLVFILELENFNNWDHRRACLEDIGHHLGQDGHSITVCRFGSEAWVREFTNEEEAARGDRLIETYPDRQEAIIVMGQTVSGDTRLVMAPLYRRPNGTVERLGTWQTDAYTRAQFPLLQAFWKGYRLGAQTTTE
jgi:hypothetical protein